MEIKYIDILIVTEEKIDETILKNFNYLICTDFNFNKYFNGSINEKFYEFNYLIMSKKVVNNILTEDKKIITNENFETSFDNYFAFGNIIKSNKTINEQLKIIIECIGNR